MLQVSKTGTRSWLLRVKVGVRRREIGLGAYPGVGVALAREKAQQTRDEIVAGIDPVAQRAAARQTVIEQQAQARALDWTFQRCAEAYIKAKAPGWRSAKHADQWRNTLATYVYPSIGDLLVRNVRIEHVVNIVEPLWTTKNETINRVRNRIELVLDWAAVRKFRTGDNPARWKGNLDKLLADRSVVAPVVGHRALPVDQLHGFMEWLQSAQGTAARCLEFVVLTACRSGEARLAAWAEIDAASKTWSIPGARMKSGRPHKVPLSDAAMALLEALPRVEGTDLLFPGARAGKPLSDMSLTATMRRMGVDAVPHGFRASFSSWCASSTAYASEVREMALAHAIGDGTVAAYQRSDLFEKRRNLMTDWAQFLSAEPSTMRNVVPVQRAIAWLSRGRHVPSKSVRFWELNQTS
ncbi:MAG TPA: tyrosine-type recombinase/integrase [Caldimonas sp.]|jgi:integrase|nr:tyrosine-type recombinase/integrase [Caldimonas sp.]HEX2541494.1 tyrosine-type recombinase/integrase [Caldimonas sp.]